MEISSFHSEDLSQFYPELLSLSSPLNKRLCKQPQDDIFPLLNHPSNNTNNNNNNSMKDIVSSFLIFEEEDTNQTQFLQFQHTSQPMNNTNNNNFFSSQNNTNIFPIHNNTQSEVTSNSKQNRNKRSRDSVAESVANSAEPPQPHQHQRRLWVKDRSKDWWEKCSHPDFPEEEFKKSFRMSKATFDQICDDLEPIITKKDTMLRAAIPVRQRVAVCIWRLATGEPLRLVSKRFGLGISTCHKLVLEVCTAIKTNLMSRFIQWPDDARLSAIKEEFESLSGIPNVGGSIYTTHIPIIAPKVNVGDYFNKKHTERNQKTSYSITVQGVVDSRGIFTDVCIGWPGSMPDEKVLEKSALYQRATRNMLNKNVFIVGNSGYPLMDWVLVPYTHQNLTWTQHAFNEKVGEIQKVAKDSFSRLKKRWGCLQKRTEVKLQELPAVLGACCVLHNICEMNNEAIDHEFDSSFELFDDEMLPENAVRSGSAVQVRDHIAHNLLHHGRGGTSFL